MPRRLPAVLLLVVGVLLAVGAPTAWALTHRDPALDPVGAGIAVALATSTGTASDEPAGPAPQESDTLGSVPTATMPTSPAAPSRSDTTTSKSSTTLSRPSTAPPGSATAAARSSTAPARSSAAAPKPSAAPSKSAVPKTVVSVPATPPTRLKIPAIGVDARVGPVGIDDRGDMAIPEQVQDIGWYQYGPKPGATKGSAVLSGHVDSAQQGLGAFSRLGELQAGDVVTVIDAAGRQLPYRVVGKEAFDKKSVPLDDLFSRSGAARLTLITCGGAFDSSAQSYVDNIVVTAVPA